MSQGETESRTRLNAADLVRISAFAFGLSGLAGAFGSLLLPVRLLDVAPEELKNSYLGILTFLGLLLAMATQPVVGAFSNAGGGRWGRRRPFIVAGSLAACVAIVVVGFAPTYGALLAAYLALQLSTNVAQAPYQAVIPDLVAEEQRGRASAAKGVAETLGALVCVGIITVPVDRYSSGRGAGWLWASLAVLGLVLLVAMAVTAGIRRRRWAAAAVAPPSSKGNLFRVDWKAAPGLPWLLLSRLFGFMAISSVGTFGFYLMRDYFKFEHPASVMATAVIVVAACVLALAYPAGLASDRVGRKPLLILAALLSAAAFGWLLLAQSYAAVLLAALGLGAATAVFYGVNWALATELVPRQRSAYYLGLVNLSVAGGSALARLSGTAIDALNSWRDGAGYTFLIAACVVYSLLSGLFLLKVPTPRRAAPVVPQPQSS